MANRKFDITLVQPGARSWGARSPKKLWKIILGTADVPMTLLADELQRVYSEKKTELVAVHLQVNDRLETWINPLMIQNLERMQQVEAKINETKGNAAARRFWLKMLKLEEFDAGLCFAGLRNEIENFKRAFEFS